jgi:hypothetical protein
MKIHHQQSQQQISDATLQLRQTASLTLDIVTGQSATLLEVRQDLSRSNHSLDRQETSLAVIDNRLDRLDELVTLQRDQMIILRDHLITVRQMLQGFYDFYMASLAMLSKSSTAAAICVYLPWMFRILVLLLHQDDIHTRRKCTRSGTLTFVVVKIRTESSFMAVVYRRGVWTCIDMNFRFRHISYPAVKIRRIRCRCCFTRLGIDANRVPLVPARCKQEIYLFS